ncbi:MAG TPA: hypothetical protein DDY78_23685 [Planctomycetales bacterium]|jgi:Flp pilus assembly protein TadG|nr:hypothetical protein [Planctomycetales bacterium]
MLFRTDRRKHRPRGGHAAVELALVVLLLTFLLLITVDFGRLFYSYVTIGACARNGAIYASSSPNSQQQSPSYNANVTTATTTAAQADGGTNLSPLPTVAAPMYNTTYNGTYTMTAPPTPVGSADGYVQVTVTWTFNTIVTYPGIPSTMNLSRTVKMRLIPN